MHTFGIHFDGKKIPQNPATPCKSVLNLRVVFRRCFWVVFACDFCRVNFYHFFQLFAIKWTIIKQTLDQCNTKWFSIKVSILQERWTEIRLVVSCSRADVFVQESTVFRSRGNSMYSPLGHYSPQDNPISKRVISLAEILFGRNVGRVLQTQKPRIVRSKTPSFI